jgi:hypothetical protein
LQACIESWGKKLLVTEFTGPAKMLYDKSANFSPLQTKTGIRLYIRSDLAKLLPPKKKIFERGKFLLKVFDAVFNTIFDLRLLFYAQKLQDLELEYVNCIDSEIAAFIQTKQQKQLFRRGVDELNWILKNPWILAAPELDRFSKKYHFSAIDKTFDFIPIKIYDKHKRLIAFLIFAKRNNNLKLPYCYFEESAESVVKVINHHILKWEIKTCTTYNPTIAKLLKNSQGPALVKKEIKRDYIIGSVLNFNPQVQDFEIQDGDADCSFT